MAHGYIVNKPDLRPGAWIACDEASTIDFHKFEISDFRAVQSMSDLDHAVFKTPIATLCDLWVARFGSGWVSKKLIVDDEFFNWTALRLRSSGNLEEHLVVQSDGKRDAVVRILIKEGG